MWLFIATLMITLQLISPPLTFRLRMISSMMVLAPYGEVIKAFPVVSLTPHKLSVYAVVGVELVATTLADKHMATVLPHLVQQRCEFPHKPPLTPVGPGASK